MSPDHQLSQNVSPEAGPSAFWVEDRFSSASDLPFSFIYGGRPSRELLDGWHYSARTQYMPGDVVARTLTFTDPATSLEVRAEARVYTDTAGVDWTVYFTNAGSADSLVLERVKTVDTTTTIRPDANLVVHRLHGSPCQIDDWMPFDDHLAPGTQLEFGATNGRSANVCPFFSVDWGDGGVITAIGWSGQWTASVSYSQDGEVRVSAGMEYFRTVLHPGETVRGPRVLQVRWNVGDHYDAYNAFRRTMLSHILPRIQGRVVTPPVAHLGASCYEMNNTTEATELSYLASIEGLGFEAYWLDAYWTRGGFPGGMGNYGFPIKRAEAEDRFPNGIKPIGDAAHAQGLKLVLWFEPERVAPGTEITREHPEWVMPPVGDSGGLYNLGIPEAREFMTEYLKTAIRKYGVNILRIDYNIDPLPFWQAANEQDHGRIGIAEIRYIEGLYQMWDDILAAFPDLFIDNCASGGRRIDLETCSRAIPLWRSDNTCEDLVHPTPANMLNSALKNQIMTAGLNRYLPFSMVGQMGADPYHFRSGFNYGIAFGEDCRPPDYPRETLKLAIEEGRRLRKFYSGNFYPVSPVTTSTRDWCVIQYHLPREDKGVVIAFRREASEQEHWRCTLREIDHACDYLVIVSRTFVPDDPVRMHGSDLASMDIHLCEAPGSAVIEYEKIQGQ